jgi:protein SCO1/2/putative membrane protein
MSETIPIKRKFLRLAGAVLWAFVGITLVGVWWMRQSNDVTAQTESAGDSPEKVIRIQPDADGNINVDQVLQGVPEPSGKKKIVTWSQDGVEEFSFKNCDGRTITKQDLLGKPWVACFVFTHCLTTCPAITNRMRELQTRFKNEDVQFVTFGVDPDRDTPEVMKNYAELNGADLSRWFFLWGNATEIYGLIHRSFQMPVKMPDEITGNYQVIHSNNMLLVNAQGVVQGKFLGTNDEEMAALAREIRRQLHPPSAASADAAASVSDVEIPADAWYMRLPAVNAGLNGLATLLLAWGYVLIKQGRRVAHKNVMLSTFAVSSAFLACYLVYHVALHQATGLPGKKFAGVGLVRSVYFTILITHVLLATAVPVLALITIYRGLKADWHRHRKIAKITYPIWMYVSVTGVIIYGMLYHWPTGG